MSITQFLKDFNLDITPSQIQEWCIINNVTETMEKKVSSDSVKVDLDKYFIPDLRHIIEDWFLEPRDMAIVYHNKYSVDIISTFSQVKNTKDLENKILSEYLDLNMISIIIPVNEDMIDNPLFNYELNEKLTYIYKGKGVCSFTQEEVNTLYSLYYKKNDVIKHIQNSDEFHLVFTDELSWKVVKSMIS